jgi:hypothetical protein
MRTNDLYLFGVDAGFSVDRKTGVERKKCGLCTAAVRGGKLELLTLETLSFTDAVDALLALESGLDFRIIVELTGTKVSWHGDGAHVTSVNIGKGLAAQEIMFRMLGKRLGFNKVLSALPRRTKVSNEEFRRETGWNGRSSEHSRDAAMLCVLYAKQNLY